MVKYRELPERAALFFERIVKYDLLNFQNLLKIT